jgi:hypothetical protein
MCVACVYHISDSSNVFDQFFIGWLVQYYLLKYIIVGSFLVEEISIILLKSTIMVLSFLVAKLHGLSIS